MAPNSPQISPSISQKWRQWSVSIWIPCKISMNSVAQIATASAWAGERQATVRQPMNIVLRTRRDVAEAAEPAVGGEGVDVNVVRILREVLAETQRPEAVGQGDE